MPANTESLRIILKGLLLGFSIAAPVGPIGLLCIRRTLERGIRSGLASGLGAASADAVYGAIAAAGLTLVADFLAGGQRWLGIFGGAFLLYLGARTFFNQPSAPAEARDSRSLAGDYASTFLLTLSNPMTIFAFIAIFSGFGAPASGAFRFSAFLLVLGVFSGSAFWWLTLSVLVNFLRQRLDARLLVIINKAAAVLIIAFALYLIYQALV